MHEKAGLSEGEGRVSGDGGELFEQQVLAQGVQRDVLPHVKTDGAHLHTHTHTALRFECALYVSTLTCQHVPDIITSLRGC